MSTVPPPWATGPITPGMPPPNSSSAVGDRPGAGGYWSGAALMVIGALLGVVVLVVGISRAVDAFAFPQVVDASNGVWIDDAGGKVIFVVGPEQSGDQFVPVAEVSVTDPDGTAVFTSPYSGSRSTTGTDGATGMTREAVAVATFHADRPGRYHLTSMDVPAGSTLGVGEGVDGNFGLLGLGVAGGGLLVLVGLVLVIVTAVRRHRNPTMPPVGGYRYASAYPQAYPYPGQPYVAPGSLAPASMPPPPGYPVPPPGPVGYPPSFGAPGPPAQGPPTGPPPSASQQGPGSAAPGGQGGRWWEAPQPGHGPPSAGGGPTQG